MPSMTIIIQDTYPSRAFLGRKIVLRNNMGKYVTFFLVYISSYLPTAFLLNTNWKPELNNKT